MKTIIRAITGAVLVSRALAGPYAPAAGVAGSDAVPANDPRFSTWASEATVVRGHADIAYPEDDVYPTYGTEADATGPADGTINPTVAPVISLGDGGTATLTFATPFSDAPGPDFAVFENGFQAFNGAYFLELGHVEVSSDGVNFFRFPSASLTPVSGTPGEGAAVDPTNVRNLAGKYIAGYGTPFDLAELRKLHPALDTQRITHVRVIDVVGTNVAGQATLDAAGRIIADPYPTEYPTGGFDLDAVGAFKATATTYAAWRTAEGIASASPAADSDQNGVPNGIEYLMGNGSLELSGNTLHFSRRAYRTDGKLKVETSTDLQIWTPIAQALPGATLLSLDPLAATVTETGDFLKDVTVQLAPSGTRRYFRLAAEFAP